LSSAKTIKFRRLVDIDQLRLDIHMIHLNAALSAVACYNKAAVGEPKSTF